MKFLTRILLFLALTGAGSFLLAELVNPLRNADEPKSPSNDIPFVEPLPLANTGEQRPPLAEPLPAAVPEVSGYHSEASDGKEILDGKEVLDAKDYKEPIGEGPGRVAGPGSLAPGAPPRGIRGRRFELPPELPPDTNVVTQN